ncbi:hypothetical protein FHS86_001744 [Roseimarinus sediminis]
MDKINKELRRMGWGIAILLLCLFAAIFFLLNILW